MPRNKYVTDFDKKVFTVLSQYERGEVSKKVLEIALGLLFEKHFGEKISQTLNLSNEHSSKSMGISLKKTTEYYNGTI